MIRKRYLKGFLSVLAFSAFLAFLALPAVQAAPAKGQQVKVEKVEKTGKVEKAPISCQVTGKSNGTCKMQTLGSPEVKPGDTVCCPVMGTKFTVTKKSYFAVIGDRKVYVCCPGCLEPLKADPAKYLKKEVSTKQGCCP